MAYEKMASRANPVLAVFVIDDSGSMAETCFGTSDKKYEWTERDMGILFKDLLDRSTVVSNGSVVIKPRYHVLVIQYGCETHVWGDGIMDIEQAIELYTTQGNSLDLKGRLNGTDSRAALQVAFDHLQKAVRDERFSDSFPPIVFHLTDGESHTDPTGIAEQIKELHTSDGNVLMVNAYIGTQTSLNYSGPEDFPGYVDVNEAGPSDDNVNLFNMSSEVPPSILHDLIERGIFPQLREGSRLFLDIRTKDQLKHAIQIVGSVGSKANRLER